jgi:hypothetical protein
MTKDISRENEEYQNIEKQLINELHEYISSCVKSIDLNNTSQNYGDYDCLVNFKCFSEHMIDMYKGKLEKIKKEANTTNV